MFGLKPSQLMILAVAGLAGGAALNIATNQPSAKIQATAQASPGSGPVQAEAADDEQQGSEEPLSDEDLLGLAMQAIDEVAAHPADPRNPAGNMGLSDEELAEVDLEEIKGLMELALPFVDEGLEARHIFALGRAAWLHNDDELAADLLTLASEKGSPAAQAYLARMDDDLDREIALLQSAVKGGFTPAQAWLDEALAAQGAAAHNVIAQHASSTFDPSRFNRPDLIDAFYRNDTHALNNELLETMTYVSAVHSFFSDTSGVLFVTNNRDIILEIDPNLSYMAQRKLLGTEKGRNQTISAGMQSMLAPFQAIADTRRAGGSINDEVGAMYNAILDTPTVRLERIQQQATQDAQRLAILYDSDPDAFRKVYAGLRSFVMEY